MIAGAIGRRSRGRVPVGNRAPTADAGRAGQRRGTWLLIFIDIDILIRNDSRSYWKAEPGRGAGWKPGTNGGGQDGLGGGEEPGF